jgi:hypothetical protein
VATIHPGALILLRVMNRTLTRLFNHPAQIAPLKRQSAAG